MSGINYRLKINRSAKDFKYIFSYGNTRKIKLALNKTGAALSVNLTKDYMEDIENPYLHGLLKEGIKRTALLHILQYQKPLEIKNLTLTITRNRQKSQPYDLFQYLIFYQMFDGPLLRPVSDEWKNPEILQNILKFQKSKDDLSKNISALYAYLFSKTKKKQTERFTYLWIAMNGYFQVFSPDPKKNEKDQMEYFVQQKGLGTHILSKALRDKTGLPAMLEVKRMWEPVTREDLDQDRCASFSAFIREKISEYGSNTFDVTPYGFMLTDFPYYLRCNLFHAGRPMQLFSFENDMELKSLRIVNSLLEDFLDQNLHKLFLNDNSDTAN